MAEGVVFQSCGHSDMWRPVSGWPIYYKDFGEFGDDVVFSGTYCLDCYLEFLSTCPEHVFLSWEEGQEWLNGDGVTNGQKS